MKLFGYYGSNLQEQLQSYNFIYHNHLRFYYLTNQILLQHFPIFFFTIVFSTGYLCAAAPFESQPHNGHLTFKLKYRRIPSYLLCTLLLYPFHLLPSPLHPTGFSFSFFLGFLAIFILLSSQQQSCGRSGAVLALGFLSALAKLEYRFLIATSDLAAPFGLGISRFQT